MEKRTKKEIVAEYKDRPIIGGVYVIRNCVNHKVWLDAVIDLQGSINRFDFSVKTGACVVMKLQADWRAMGKESFTLEVLETIEKPLEQSLEAFKEDMAVHKALWFEKLDPTAQWY